MPDFVLSEGTTGNILEHTQVQRLSRWFFLSLWFIYHHTSWKILFLHLQWFYTQVQGNSWRTPFFLLLVWYFPYLLVDICMGREQSCMNTLRRWETLSLSCYRFNHIKSYMPICWLKLVNFQLHRSKKIHFLPTFPWLDCICIPDVAVLWLNQVLSSSIKMPQNWPISWSGHMETVCFVTGRENPYPPTGTAHTTSSSSRLTWNCWFLAVYFLFL